MPDLLWQWGLVLICSADSRGPGVTLLISSLLIFQEPELQPPVSTWNAVACLSALHI